MCLKIEFSYAQGVPFVKIIEIRFFVVEKIVFLIILIKKERTSAYENSILRHNLWKKFGKTRIFRRHLRLFWWKGAPPHENWIFGDVLSKISEKLGFSIPLMKSSPPNTWKMDFWRNFVQILEKNSNFRLSWCKGAPHTWKLVSATFCEKFRKTSGAFLLFWITSFHQKLLKFTFLAFWPKT